MNKKTLTINLTENEFSILERICIKKGISKTGLVRQAIRLYQHIDKRLDVGELLFSETDKLRKQILIIS